uniref:Myb/SANT-like DNA-binding domain-containing protein n=1 Tax=Magallana gigas TaxID=29159 RepID=A0A8W8MJ34_MAGGI
MDAKKQRKANFSDVEVEVLVDAVGTSYKILYGKFSPCLTNNMKTMAWESVTEKQIIVGKFKLTSIDASLTISREHVLFCILQLIPQSAISGIEAGVDTSEVRSSLQMSQKPSCLEIQPFIVTEGKRKNQTFNEYSYGSQRLIEIEEEKLSIKKQRLEIEKERLEILKNFYALFSSSNVQSVCNLLSEF